MTQRISKITTQFELTLAITTRKAKGLGLTTNEWATLIAISDYADDNFTCFPSVDTLAEDTGLSLSTVQRATKALCDKGWISKQRRFNNSNVYEFDVGKLLHTPVTETGQTGHTDRNVQSQRLINNTISNTNNNKREEYTEIKKKKNVTTLPKAPSPSSADNKTVSDGFLELMLGGEIPF